MYPRFLGIGAQKAGTTWLYENLRRHPALWLPPVKELHYLDQKPPHLSKRLFGKATPMRTAREHLRAQLLAFARGRGDRRELAWAARYCLLPRSDAWYRSLFPEDGERMPGEICPGYARLDAEAVGLVQAPDARRARDVSAARPDRSLLVDVRDALPQAPVRTHRRVLGRRDRGALHARQDGAARRLPRESGRPGRATIRPSSSSSASTTTCWRTRAPSWCACSSSSASTRATPSSRPTSRAGATPGKAR